LSMNRLGLTIAMLVAGCGGGSASHPDAGPGGTGPGGGGGGGASGMSGGGASGAAGTGGTSRDGSADATEVGAPTMNRVRFLNAFIGDTASGNPGGLGPLDVWMRDAAQNWVSVIKAIPYGAVTSFVPLTFPAGQAKQLTFIPPGADPATAARAGSNQANLYITAGDMGRQTAIVYNAFGAVALGTRADDDPASAPPAGKANVIFDTRAILEQFAGFGFNYGYTGLCLNDLTAEGKFSAIDPGTFQFSLYDAHAANCQGSVIVTAPATAYGAGQAWFLYAVGDAVPNGYNLVPVRLGGN
jgi:hypothetical protein